MSQLGMLLQSLEESCAKLGVGSIEVQYTPSYRRCTYTVTVGSWQARDAILTHFGIQGQSPVRGSYRIGDAYLVIKVDMTIALVNVAPDLEKEINGSADQYTVELMSQSDTLKYIEELDCDEVTPMPPVYIAQIREVKVFIWYQPPGFRGFPLYDEILNIVKAYEIPYDASMSTIDAMTVSPDIYVAIVDKLRHIGFRYSNNKYRLHVPYSILPRFTLQLNFDVVAQEIADDTGTTLVRRGCNIPVYMFVAPSEVAMRGVMSALPCTFRHVKSNLYSATVYHTVKVEIKTTF